jgi:CubicO group peptidase (beta-lactamase class C family)
LLLRDPICGLLLICGLIFAGAATAGVPHAAAPDFRKIDAYLAGVFERSRLPGMAVAVVRNDATVYFRGLGVSRGDAPVTQDTLFVLGSTTKAFTALATLQLVDAGKLRLDDAVGHVLPGFLHGSPAAEQITIRSLLNQTSGISNKAGDQPVWFAGEIGPNAIRDWAGALDAGALDRSPGTFEYSNANYIVLGALIERASGETYAQYIREHIFLPLQMTDSHASMAGVDFSRMARGHRQFFGADFEAGFPYPPAFVPAGFVITSARDLAKYIAAQLPGSRNAGALGLSAASFALWHEGRAAMDPGGTHRYAMGWMTAVFNGVPVIAHPGDMGVFSSEFVLMPGQNWGVVVLADGSGWLSSQYLHEMASGIVSQLVGRQPRDDTGIHRIVLAMLLAITAIPCIQLFALWKWGRRKASLPSRLWPVGLHMAAAIVLIAIFPRVWFPLPFSELLISFPDLGCAAFASGVFALIALALALRAGRKPVVGQADYGVLRAAKLRHAAKENIA